MPTVTAVRRARGAYVDVELDGARWRRLPVEVAVACGLQAGIELDRPLLRRLRARLRRVEAAGAAARALRHRDLSSTRLTEELARRGVAAHDRRATVAALQRTGVVDDPRFAASRAALLAERGYGDAAIRWRLAGAGLADELVEEAIAVLEPEVDRARPIIAREGRSARTARMLSRRGFGVDAVDSAVPVAD